MVVVFRLFDMTITIKEEMNGISDDIRGHVHMTSALRGREGVAQFLTKGREVAWIWN